MNELKPWATFPMHERCPSCGVDLERVKAERHQGYHVSEGITYWQFCHNCTWMGPPNLFERRAQEREVFGEEK